MREGETEQFTLQMATRPELSSSASRSLELFLVSHMGTVAQGLAPSSAAFLDNQVAELEVEPLDSSQHPYGMLAPQGED